MRIKHIKPNGAKVQGKSFKTILNEMMKLTTGGNLKIANSNWDIFQKQPMNNIRYNKPVGA